MIKRLAGMLTAVFLLSLSPPQAAGGGPAVINFLVTGDTAGYLEPCG